MDTVMGQMAEHDGSNETPERAEASLEDAWVKLARARVLMTEMLVVNLEMFKRSGFPPTQTDLDDLKLVISECLYPHLKDACERTGWNHTAAVDNRVKVFAQQPDNRDVTVNPATRASGAVG